MKVTKTLESYIRDKVDAKMDEKFAPELKVFSDQDAELAAIQAEAVSELTAKAKAIVKDISPIFINSNDYERIERYMETAVRNFIRLDNRGWDSDWMKLQDKIRAETNKKINEIIVALELGGTKETLDKMLEEI